MDGNEQAKGLHPIAEIVYARLSDFGEGLMLETDAAPEIERVLRSLREGGERAHAFQTLVSVAMSLSDEKHEKAGNALLNVAGAIALKLEEAAKVAVLDVPRPSCTATPASPLERLSAFQGEPTRHAIPVARSLGGATTLGSFKMSTFQTARPRKLH